MPKFFHLVFEQKVLELMIFFFFKPEIPRLEGFNLPEILVGPSLTHWVPREGLRRRLEDNGVLGGFLGEAGILFGTN